MLIEKHLYLYSFNYKLLIENRTDHYTEQVNWLQKINLTDRYEKVTNIMKW
jgi:hypothetical protein